MQAEAVVTKVAGRSRQHDGDKCEHRQNSSAGEEAEKADVDRGVDQGRPGAALQQEPEAVRPGDHLPRRVVAAGEGGGAGLVLQSAAEGEADDTAKLGRYEDNLKY